MELSPEALTRLTKLHLRTKVVVDGLTTGSHRSPSRGQSVEFAEHKEYAPGDEIRHIDWRAYGKLDRYYVKRFEQETNLDAYLVVDGSSSMGFGETDTKYAAASVLATSLATVLTRQQDRVGLALWRADRLKLLPPHSSPSHFNHFTGLLVEAEPQGGTDLGAIADGLAEKLRRRSLVIVLSDLLDSRADGLARLTALKARGHDIAILQVLDPAELDFPYEEPTLFLSMEDERRLEVSPRELRRGYLIELQRFLAETTRHCRERDCDYALVRTDSSLEAALAGLLGRRAKRRGLASA